MELPQGARDAMESHYGEGVWTLLHAWVEEETVLAVVATAPDEAFDESADAFDVDSVELHLLRIFDTRQGSWDVMADHQLRFDALFEELVQTYFDTTDEGAEA